MKRYIITLSIIIGVAHTNALIVSEIMSNPVGDDGGREWIEIYNNESTPVDISSLAVSIKGGTPVGVILLQGDLSLQPNGYAILSSIVSASSPVSKFLDASLGYPSYTGTLVRVVSSISLVNTGVTSLDIRLQGSVVDTVSSYTPASEGKTFSRISGSFVTGTPTPGTENQTGGDVLSQSNTTNTQSVNQTSITPISPPSPDIFLYLPKELLVVAGAETNFSVYGMTRSGKTIENLKASWAFGDGGQGVGTTTTYTYAYPGRYIAHVEAGDAYVMGFGRILVTVVSPELFISSFSVGKYGAYIDITNPNTYDLDVSQWKLHVGDGIFPFPKNTILSKQSVTHMSGRAMGFASTTVHEGSSIKITFPNQEEITSFVYTKATTSNIVPTPSLVAVTARPAQIKNNVVKQVTASSTVATVSKSNRDTRLVSWFRALFR